MCVGKPFLSEIIHTINKMLHSYRLTNPNKQERTSHNRSVADSWNNSVVSICYLHMLCSQIFAS